MLSESDQQKADFERHRAEPDVSVDDYLRRRQIELGRSLEGRRIVYLDMWVWNRISDHILKGTNDPSMAALHRRLLAEAAAGRVVCPVSESILLELMKQSDPRTRMAAAEVIDALGGGACLMAPDTRINTEVAHWVYESATTKSLVPLDHLVWTVVPYVLGAMHPVDNRFPAAEQRVIQKAFIDRLWRTRLVDMVQTLDQPKWKFDAMEGIAQRLNDGNRNHLAELTSFRKVYADEATGGADLFAPMARRIIADVYTKETGQPPPEASDGTQQTERTLRALMAKSLIDGGSRHVLRSLHIQAACHAAVRWNRGQKLSANTLFDFHHATAALAYCDAFLCDRPMAAFLTADLIILDQEMGCFVASTAEALMAWLDERLALFNLAIDSKLRGCDLVNLRVADVADGGAISSRAIVLQRKTGRPVQFEITQLTRESVAAWIAAAGLRPGDYLFPTRLQASLHLSTRQYARIVHAWVDAIGLEGGSYGTHTMRRTKASLIYRRTRNLRAVQLLLGHTKLESTVRYLGIEVDDALEIAEQTEV